MRGPRKPAIRTQGGVHQRAAPFVLAMLCLRAFIPAGFMLAPIEGHLSMVLCDSAAAGASHHAGHHHPGHVPDPTCPYAQSAGPAPLPALPALPAAPVATATALPTQFSQLRAPSGPVRQQSARAPPQFA